MMLETYKVIISSLAYDPESGLLRWKVRKNGYKGGVKPGDIAGTPHDGYVQVIIDQRSYRAHRLAWLLQTGEFPPTGFEIDHINGIRSDNRWDNLRLASRSDNNANRKSARFDSGTGVRGVHRRHDGEKFFARITVNRKIIHLGQFDSIKAAAAARREAEHKYFGQFCPSKD